MERENDVFSSDNPSLSEPIRRVALGHGGDVGSAIDCTAPPCSGLGLPVQLIADSLDGSVQSYLRASLSTNTRRAYLADLQGFLRWGGAVPATPDVVARYLADRAGHLTAASLKRGLVGIGKAHLAVGAADPTKAEIVRATMRGICRVHGVRQRQSKPVLRADILLISDALGDDTTSCRDRALLLLGFAGGFRRGELVELHISDLNFVAEGVVVTLRRGKTDQEGVGRQIGVPFGRTRACPVRALRAWLSVAALETGPLFRSIAKGGRIGRGLTAQSVGLILRRCAHLAGLSMAGLTSHSLRSGLVTSAARAGVSSWKIRQQTGHKSDAVMARYIRDAELFEGNAVSELL